MCENKPTLLILAAGLASRYGSLKQIDRIGPSGERIIDYSVYDAINAGFGKIVYVIRRSFKDEFEDVILNELPDDIVTDYVFQEMHTSIGDFSINENRIKPWGTGHALLTAAEVIENPFVVINADDFYGSQSYKLTYDFCKKNSHDGINYALVGYQLDKTTSDYGPVSRGICTMENDNLKSVIERTDIQILEHQITYKDADNIWKKLTGKEIVSMNMFVFTPSIFSYIKNLFSDFLTRNSDNLNSEFFLPTVIDNLIKRKQVNVSVLRTKEQWFGLTYKEDKKIVKGKITDLVNQAKYPNKLWP